MIPARSPLLMILAVLGAAGCGEDEPIRSPQAEAPDAGEPDVGEPDAGRPDAGPAEDEREPCLDKNPLRNTYFGDLHVHTSYSFDAYINGTRPDPAAAYRFARGEPVSLPPLDEQGRGTTEVRLRRPLDFVAVTDHAEYLAEVSECTTPGSPGFDLPRCQTYRQGGQSAITAWGVPLTALAPGRLKDLCGEDGQGCLAGVRTVWDRVQEAAEGAYDRSSACALTTFVGYEWTGNTLGSNLHRNVIFRNHVVPDQPISYFEAPTAEGLWSKLAEACNDAGQGCDALVIPHNSNLSNGRMFAPIYPGAEDDEGRRAQAEMRARMEPLVEIIQHKGASECNNGLSGVFGAEDELCDFEQLRGAPFEDCGDEVGFLGIQAAGCVSRYDSARPALLEGLRQQSRLGVNPTRLGFIGSTDTHNSTPGAVDEADYKGHTGTQEVAVDKRLEDQILPFGLVTNPGGLAGVWAEENTRDAIFEALRRRETWATSGPRIAVRLFGGWSLGEELCDAPDMLEQADAGGVPMGGVLAPRPAGAGAPRFLVSALRDPDPEATALQKIQIVKGWLDGEALHYKVFEVAGGGDEQAGVDLETCAPQGAGASSLCAVWEDPEYEEGASAFYYARVVENPSCRWSWRLCLSLEGPERPASCEGDRVQRVIQEMAWTSPIWTR